MKLVVLSVLVAAALAAAGCGGKAEEGSQKTAVGGYSGGAPSSPDDASISAAEPLFSSAPAAVDGITVVGVGTADVVPDIADWSFGVTSRATTASGALAANASAMKDVVGALRDAGIREGDLRTEQVSLYPETADDGRTVTGYVGSSMVTATARDIGNAGRVVDAAVHAGATDISGPNLRPSDTNAPYKEAVDKAFDDARAHAEAIAAKAGVSLGAPVAIVEGGGPAPVPIYGRALAADAAEVAIEPGKQQVTATLTVTFSIANAA